MKGINVGIVGAGRSGLAAAHLLRRLGATVLLSDRARLPRGLAKGIELESGKHSNRLLKCALVIRSPGVPAHLSIIKKIAHQGIPIWSELELAGRYTKASHLAAITGTNGKTTVTTLVGEFFRKSRRPTFVVGNIGTPLSEVALRTTDRSSIALEVSSYQLENIVTFRPTVSAILNITPDHLEHHGSLRAYVNAKARIFENQRAEDVCVLNADDRRCRALAKRCPARVLFFSRRRTLRMGVFMQGDDVVVRWGSLRARFPLKSHLPGAHNIENILASVGIGLAAGVSLPVMRRTLAGFRGVEHRLETVRTLRGVRYDNDSKATNVDSTRVALAAYPGPLIVIMGGEGKGSPYTPLVPLLRGRVRKVLLIGEDAAAIEKAFRGRVDMERRQDMGRAVRRAAGLAAPGDVVLLTPACASFDQYRNYEERGRHFKALVKALR